MWTMCVCACVRAQTKEDNTLYLKYVDYTVMLLQQSIEHVSIV